MGTKFAIVGGGIVGASIAYHLSERNYDQITVFERKESLAAETTAKSNAMFRMSGSENERRMKRYALALYNEFLADPALNHDTEPLYERLDRVEVATSSDEVAALRDRAKAGPGDYIETDTISENLMFPELRNDDIKGALWFPDSIRFEPRVLALEFIERARSNGVRFETETAVRDIEKVDGRIKGVKTDTGRLEADVVVSAAGPKNVDIAEMAGIDLPLRHTLGPILDLRPQRLGHTVPNLKHTDSGIYYTGRSDGTVMIGRAGGGYRTASRRNLDTLDENLVPQDIRMEMVEITKQLMPAISINDTEIRDQWVGLVSKTPDGEPIIGRTEINGFAIAAFHSEAIQLSPAAGRIMTEQLIDNQSVSKYSHVSPARFKTHTDYSLH